jgi:uncharacterized membrane protein
MRTDASQPTGDGVNANPDAPNTVLCGRWLFATRAGWVTVAALTLGLVAAEFAVGLDRPELILPRSAQAAIAQAAIPGQLIIVVGLIIPMAAFAGISALIFWRRSDDRQQQIVP